MENKSYLERMREELSEKEFAVESKRMQVLDLLAEIYDPLIANFFDTNSSELLDEKIEVLTALKEGKKISEIPKYYDVLELYPDEYIHWDL